MASPAANVQLLCEGQISAGTLNRHRLHRRPHRGKEGGAGAIHRPWSGSECQRGPAFLLRCYWLARFNGVLDGPSNKGSARDQLRFRRFVDLLEKIGRHVSYQRPLVVAHTFLISQWPGAALPLPGFQLAMVVSAPGAYLRSKAIKNQNYYPAERGPC
jgi:hypothetical protein